MDQNKLEKLRKIDYKINKSCDTCVFSNFRMNNDYGFCMLHTYDHIKHTDENMPLSIFRLGVCPSYSRSSDGLGPWSEFLEAS